MTTALYTHPAALTHINPDGHPEQVARLRYILDALDPLDLDRRAAPLAEESAVLRCHPQRHLDRLRNAAPTSGDVALDGDTWMSPGSLEAAWRGAGANVAAVDAVMAGEVANAFVAMRPPGHHCETETPMGFCLLGNIAIAAKHAAEIHGLSRVAVVDFDVHHGNGTQDLLWNEPRTLFISTHQSPLYPGSGAMDEMGAHGNILNLPLRPMGGGAEARAAFIEGVLPRLDDYEPELILISAGFDAHAADPLANLNWTEDDFAWMTHQLCDIADRHCAGRVVSTLEGGYDLEALARSVRAHVEVLMERGQ